MFGYVTINKSELKFKEYDQYRRYYCGLCRRLKALGGRRCQAALSYDTTFLVILLSSLCEPEETRGTRRCAAHPFRKQEYLYNVCTDYAADMTVVLAYYKSLDDFEDEKKRFRKLYALSLRKRLRGIENKYGGKADRIKKAMETFSRIEAEAKERNGGSADGESALDELAGAFGNVLAEVFSFVPSKADEIWIASLGKIGYEIGRFLYLTDAYDDLERDRKKGCFNPLKKSSLTGDAFDEWTKDALSGMIAGAAREFEKLPIIENAGILRNILYSGVWTRFYQVRDGRGKKREKEKKDPAEVL